MNSSDGIDRAAELRKRAEEKLGHARAEALRNDLEQLARELDALEKYSLEFDDEP
jgi:hypothetical protein